MDQQYRVRAELTCTNCGMDKSAGLLLCWPCHHSQKRFNDGSYSNRVQTKLANREAQLKASGAPIWRAT